MINSKDDFLTIDNEDPVALAETWLSQAQAAEINDHNAMALATVDETGLPNVRMVLLKGFDARGFVFYTNMTSAKGGEILSQPRAAINFHWKSLRRQLRARGALERVTEAESDAYFQSRSRGSRLASTASDQSSPLSSREELLARVRALEEKYGTSDESGDPVPRPDHWYGHRLLPTYIEFWQDGEFRLHDRFAFTRKTTSAPWQVQRLNP